MARPANLFKTSDTWGIFEEIFEEKLISKIAIRTTLGFGKCPVLERLV